MKFKKNMQELGPKAFNEEEKQAFDETDAAEWRQWLASGLVAVVAATRESSIPRELIFSTPVRCLRATYVKKLLLLLAKSRLISPGHRDPQVGLYGTDSPKTSNLAVMVVATLAAAQGWYFLPFFNVSTAFLSGKEIGRVVYVRGPADGLPSVNGRPALRPYQLLQVLKGAYGLTESPGFGT